MKYNTIRCRFHVARFRLQITLQIANYRYYSLAENRQLAAAILDSPDEEGANA
jgi:hypothetical protein